MSHHGEERQPVENRQSQQRTTPKQANERDFLHGAQGGPDGGQGEFESAQPRTMGKDTDFFTGADDFRAGSAPLHDTGPNSNAGWGSEMTNRDDHEHNASDTDEPQSQHHQ